MLYSTQTHGLYLPQVLKYKRNAPRIWSQAFNPPFGGPFRSSSIVADESEERTPGPLSTRLCSFPIVKPNNLSVQGYEAEEASGNLGVALLKVP